MTDEQRIKVLADALQDLISMAGNMQFKRSANLRRLLPEEVVNLSVKSAREAFEQTGIRVRKTGRV